VVSAFVNRILADFENNPPDCLRAGVTNADAEDEAAESSGFE
jgi:hypothetical protein